MYEGCILRTIIDDVKVGNHKRFRTSTMLGFEYQTLKSQSFTVTEQSEERIVIECQAEDKPNLFRDEKVKQHQYKYIIYLKPFKIEGYIDNQLMVIANNNQFLNFEYERTMREHFQIFNKVPYDATYKFQLDINDNNQFTEMFDGYVDTFIHGPRAIGMDFEFSQEYLFGIPEHAISFNLQDTLFTEEYSQPYRLYNLDVFPYELNSTQALYGSIPYLISHSNSSNAGNVGVYWSNAAETWVDLFTPHSDLSPLSSDNHLKRVATFNSESGVLEFILIIGTNPHQVTMKWADISGHAPMPPYWSLGYHQSRWSYETAQDIIEINQKFDQHQLPLDVVWLDIDHTNNFEYFSWNEATFGDKELRKMNEVTELRQRKIVSISDPHIKQNQDYFVYKGILQLEQESLKKDEQNHKLTLASGKYLVRDPKSHDKIFVGQCWPGKSVWLDFMQLKVRQFWTALYQFDVYKTNKNYFVWNDMNEPSVFDKPELTLPKGAIHYTDQGNMVENREIHNFYGALMHQASYYGLILRNEDQNQRPFVLSRSFYTGSQKFGAVWTGDNSHTYEDLKMSIHMLLSMSISGLGFVGADIGGFGDSTTTRVLVQWHNLGMFYPFMRQHCHKETSRREPYLYKGEAFNQIQRSLRQRQRMLPYMYFYPQSHQHSYTKFYEYHRYGIPLMRPMFMEFPDPPQISLFNDQFMFGDIFLVKPDEETYKDTSKTQIYLPEGTWYDYYTNRQYTVKQAGLYEVPQESGNYIYVLTKGGTILPLKDQIKQSSLLARKEPYILNVYLETDEYLDQYAHGHLYLDDGETFNYQKKNEYQVVQFEFKDMMLKGKISEKGTYQSDYEQIAGIQFIGVNKKTMEQIDYRAVIRYKVEGKWDEKVVKTEKLEDFQMAVILDPQINLMYEEWIVVLNI